MLNITIIGMGLIGTSLGMALRSAEERDAPLGPITVIGYDRDARAVADARGRLAIDRQAANLQEALRDAHLVVLAVPAQAIHELLQQIAPLLRQGVVVTDVTSTKAQVIDWARQLLPTGVAFVGGHPMAGKERSGAAAADPDLFKGAIYCLTPLTSTPPEALELVNALVEQVGAKPYYIDPVEHDSFVAGVSHLPFMLSTALVEATSRGAAWREMAPLAASGYRDISRLASGDPEMHRDICLTNRAALIRWIDEMIEVLRESRELIEAQDAEALLALFERTRQAREAWLATRPHLRPGEQDFANLSGVDVERPSLFGRLGGRSRDRRKR